MSTQKSVKKRLASTLATVTTALVVASGLALAPTTAFAAEASEQLPTLSVSKSQNLNSEGEEITVKGSGYNVDVPIYIAFCADVPLADLSFNFIAAGCTAGAKLVLKDPTKPSYVKFGEDGSFETTITVSPRPGSAGKTALYTLADHNNPDYRGQDAKAELNFTVASGTDSDPQPEPTVLPSTVAPKVTAASYDKLSIEARIGDIPASSGGVYAALTEKGNTELTQADMAHADYVTKDRIVNGAATAAINISDAGTLDRAKQYEIIVWEHRSLPTASNIYARGDLAVTAAQWDKVFTKPVTIPFTDMKKGDKFYNEIAWMYTQGISTGTKQKDGSVKYLPKDSVTREAMAAFLFRHYGDKNYKAPASVKFTDVKEGDKFYKEIAWMAEKGISTGTKQADGSVKFEPKSEISREAMAAFLYRADDSKKPKPLTTSPFADMKKGDKFYKEILWMSQAKISTGNKNGNNKPNYLPKDDVTREAMAAFIYRAAK